MRFWAVNGLIRSSSSSVQQPGDGGHHAGLEIILPNTMSLGISNKQAGHADQRQ